MKLISHRANLNGPDETRENQVWAIEECIAKGYLVEVDFWLVNGRFYLSHDVPTEEDRIDEDFLYDNLLNLLIHCKNREAISLMEVWDVQHDGCANWFTNDTDRWSLTSKKNVISYCKKEEIVPYSIVIMPEHHNITKEDLKNLDIWGVCTDFVDQYSNRHSYEIKIL